MISTTPLGPVGVRGVVTWTEDDGAPRPDLLPPSLRRRTSLLTRVTADLLSRLAGLTGVDLAGVAQVHGSAFGEIHTTVGLLAMMHEGDGALSPTRFHNSVHNTAAGYCAIVTGNRTLSTSVAAGPTTTTAALLEAFSILHGRTEEVVLVIAEESLPEPLGDQVSYSGLGVALHLVRNPTGERSTLTVVRDRPPPPPELPWSLQRNPCAVALVLARALLGDGPGAIALERATSDGMALCANVTF